MQVIYIYIYIYITCTEENRLPTNKNFIQTQRVSASAFIRGLYIYIYELKGLPPLKPIFSHAMLNIAVYQMLIVTNVQV